MTNAAESPVVPIVNTIKINLSDWTKHSTEIKEKSHRGNKESQQTDSSMWNSEKLVAIFFYEFMIKLIAGSISKGEIKPRRHSVSAIKFDKLKRTLPYGFKVISKN